jgi:hypothetical protein
MKVPYSNRYAYPGVTFKIPRNPLGTYKEYSINNCKFSMVGFIEKN